MQRRFVCQPFVEEVDAGELEHKDEYLVVRRAFFPHHEGPGRIEFLEHGIRDDPGPE